MMHPNIHEEKSIVYKNDSETNKVICLSRYKSVC